MMRSQTSDWEWDGIGRNVPLGADTRIEIVSASGEVLWANDPAARGAHHDIGDPVCASCHRGGAEEIASQPTFINAADGETGDVFAAPLMNDESCRACHAGDRSKLGMVYVRSSFASVDQLIGRARLGLVIAGVIILASAALTARVAVEGLAGPPTKRPMAATRGIGERNRDSTELSVRSEAVDASASRRRDDLPIVGEDRENLRILYGIAEELGETVTPEDRRRCVVQLVSSIFKSDSLLISGHAHPQAGSFHGVLTYCRADSRAEELPYPSEGIEEIAPYYNQRLVDRWLRGDLDWTSRVIVGSTVAYPLERHGRRLGLFLVPARPRGETGDGRATAANPDVVHALRKHLSVTLELSELQREQLQQERFAAIGATVAGLAHCLKNTLNALKGGQYVIERALESDDNERLVRGWRVLKDGVRHIERLTHDMLLFAVDRRPKFEPVDPRIVLQEVVDLLQETAEHQGIELVTDYGEGIGPMLLDRHTLYRAILNLATNAIDACVDSETGDRVVFRCRQRGDSLVLTIEDNGVGIPGVILRRVTERFFTTKASKGTGLGLPVVQKIAELHGGSLEVESVLGKGSAFHLVIPRKTETAPIA